jgi:hypothetical protein
MRLSVLLSTLACLASPALAADSIADQAQEAFDVFAGGLSQPDFSLAGYGTVALKDVAGQWVGLNGPAAGTGIETYGSDTEKSCKSPAVLTLASPDAVTLTLSAKPAAAGFTQIYTLVSGTTFSQYTDPEEYFTAIGLGPEKSGREFDQARALALGLANGVVDIYRPSEDIVVIARDKAYPTVLARCPA